MTERGTGIARRFISCRRPGSGRPGKAPGGRAGASGAGWPGAGRRLPCGRARRRDISRIGPLLGERFGWT